jgi:hypothetical protein
VNFRALLCVLVSIPVMAQSAAVGLKITVRQTWSAGPSSEETQYIQFDRSRNEYRNSSGLNYGPPLASVTRCDMGEIFELNLEDKQFVSAPIPKFPTEAEQQALTAKYSNSAMQRTPTVLVEVTTVETGERRKMFGYETRHVITKRKHTRLNQAKDLMEESATDGWYTDLPTALSCYPRPKAGGIGFATLETKSGPADVPTVKLVGKPESGFPLSMTTTSHDVYVLPDGSKREANTRLEQQVTELYSGPLDPQLFEVPRGFARVAQLRRNPSVPFSVRMQEAWNSLKQRISRMFSGPEFPQADKLK